MSKDRDNRKRNERALRALVAEVYNYDGQRIWWAAYKRADEAERARMQFMVRAGNDGAAS